MGNQLAQVAGENPLGIMFCAMGLAAQAMGTKVGHDHAKALGRDACCGSELDPVDVGVGKQAMEQDDGAAAAGFAPRELDAVRGVPAVS